MVCPKAEERGWKTEYTMQESLDMEFIGRVEGGEEERERRGGKKTESFLFRKMAGGGEKAGRGQSFS